ncbi:hypothetical protein K492DRAFT_205372 [Lichtheimia hyalospora FSU 10163]|nr:hypothetical protein K492DRAFT_205372 [Lichtheimia hyalospora FSU 10163]
MRGGKRLIALGTVLFILFVYTFSTFVTTQSHSVSTSCQEETPRRLAQPHLPSSSSSSKLSSSILSSSSSTYYLNLNNLNATSKARERGEHILVLTPLTNTTRANSFLERYFELLDRSTYPNHLISIGLLVTEQSLIDSNSFMQQIQQWQGRWSNAFNDIHVYERHMPDLHIQHNGPYQRSLMARARNVLLTAALREYHSWVAWIDVEVIDYPPSIFDDLMRANVDVIVPNCLLQREDHVFWAYDRNNWAETDYSLDMQQRVGQDYIMMEGYNDVASGRSLLVDMPTHLGSDHRVRLDSVGTTFTLVKSHVHREGANFPPFVYQHQVETEAFGKVANAMGFSVYGVPGYTVYHAGDDTTSF